MKRWHVRADSTRTTSRSSPARSKTERKSGVMGDVVVNGGGKRYFEEGRFAVYERAMEEVVAKRNVVRDFKKNEEDFTLV